MCSGVRCMSHFPAVDSPSYRLAGYLWQFALPLSQLGIHTYIDENALQPSQVPEADFIRPTHTDFVYL